MSAWEKRPTWVEQQIPVDYADVMGLKKCLDEIFQEKKYAVKGIRLDHFHLQLPRRLTHLEVEQINNTASKHRRAFEENEAIRQTSSRIASSKGRGSGKTAAQPDPSRNATMIQSIPEVRTMPGKPRCFTTESAFSTFERITFQSSGDDKVFEGFYGREIEEGEASKVFKVEAELGVSSSGCGGRMPVFGKFAVKRLRESTTFQQFQAEYEVLKQVRSLRHPHIVETLTAWRREEQGSQMFAFMFPLALGNLKGLFRGDFDNTQSVSEKTPFLWSQFIGLASAVAYLHETCHIAHRDIKPSNVLFSVEEGTEQIILQITDFGLSVDLSNAMTWQEGSAAEMSALVYDAPEYRSAMLARQEGKNHPLPSVNQLLSNDIWKLGCTLTELSAFITGGSKGVHQFRDSIVTETRIGKATFILNSFENFPTGEPHFDDGERVKSEVLDVIDDLSIQHGEVAAIRQILRAMLAEASARPKARDVCEYLVERTTWAGRLHNDGTRLVELQPGSPNPHVSWINKLRLRIEHLTRHPIDWYPFPPLLRPCLEGEMHVIWQYGDKQLSVNLSSDEAQRYKKYCLPAFSNGYTYLPTTRSQGQPAFPPPTYRPSRVARASGVGPPTASNAQAEGPLLDSSRTMGQQTTSNNQFADPSLDGDTMNTAHSITIPSKELYWCIRQPLSESKDVMRQPISLQDEMMDADFYKRTEQAFAQAQGAPLGGWFGWVGWILYRLSWKCCVSVDFNQFYIIEDEQDRVHLAKIGLPDPRTSVEYEHGIDPDDDIQRKLVAAQIVYGLRHPESFQSQRAVISMLPKKRVPPDFQRTMRAEGWGMHPEMGLSAKKMLQWLLFCFIFMIVSVAPWLIWHDRFDLQNAFVPGGTILTIFTTFVAIAQVVG